MIRLFHEGQPRAFPSESLAFGCTCSYEKVAAVLRQYAQAALAEMTTAQGEIEADCQFCGARYRFDPSIGVADKA